MITVYRLDGTEPTPVAEWEDGEWVEGGDEMESIFGTDPPTRGEIEESLDGPRYFAGVDEPPEEGKSWVPYTGPQGGSGWRNLETGDIIYQDEPPGELLDPDELTDAAEEAGLDPDRVQELADELEAAQQEAAQQEALDDDGPVSVDSRDEIEIGDTITASHAGQEIEASVSGKPYGSDNLYVTPEDPSQTGGQTRITVSLGDVESVERYEELDSEAEVAASKAVAAADTSKLSSETVETVEETVTETASRAKHTETSERMFGMVGSFNRAEDRGGGLSENRASYSTKASMSASPNAKGHMTLAESSNPKTVDHEYAHALADSYGFSNPTGTGVSHRYPEEGVPDWDFGEDGEHGLKRRYMLTSYGDWEERGDHDYDDYADRGQPVDPVDSEVGDRLAARVDGDVVEGTVTPPAQPVQDIGQLEEGETISADYGEDVTAVELPGHDTPLGPGPGNWDGIEDGEVVATLEEGDWLVIGVGDTYPLPPGADPQEVEQQEDVADVIQVSGDKALIEDADADDEIRFQTTHADAITSAKSTLDQVLRAPDGTGYSTGDMEDALEMAGKEDRDWVDVQDYGGVGAGFDPMSNATVRGETVKFKFGAQDEATEGVITGETEGQFVITHMEDGEQREKQVNKADAYNQQIWFAQDETEFADDVQPDREPPGLREAQYETVDIYEGDVDWDTSIQYDDPADRVEQVDLGDIVLVRDPDGDRHVMDVGDMFDSFTEGENTEFQGKFGPESEYDNTNGAAQVHGRVDFGENTDWDIVGHSPQEDWVGEAGDRSGEPADRWDTVDIGTEEGMEELKGADRARLNESGETVDADVDHRPMEDYVMVYPDDGGRYWVPTEGHGRVADGEAEVGQVYETGHDGLVEAEAGVESLGAGEYIDGGFEVDDAEDIEPGMLVQVRHDDGTTEVAQVEEVPADNTVATDQGVFETFDEADSTVVKAAAEGGPDAGEVEPPTHEEAAKNLCEEANKAWFRMSTERERGNDRRAAKNHISDEYSETNANETLTKTQEVMQGHSVPSVASSMVDRHPDLVEAYMDVFEPADDVKQELNDKHDENPHSTPWDEVPFPDAGTSREWPDPGESIELPPGYDADEATVDGLKWTFYRGGSREPRSVEVDIDGETVEIDADEFEEAAEQ